MTNDTSREHQDQPARSVSPESPSVDPHSIEGLFLAALGKGTASERAAYLDEACEGDAVLRRRVDALLLAYDDAGSFLEKPAVTPPASTDEPSLDFLAPTDKPGCIGTIGSYEVIDVIGRGGMGVVLRALDPKLNRIVAVKALAPELAAIPNARRRFLREAQAAAAVSHPHVVTIHAVDEGQAGPAAPPYLVMECIVGQSLQQKIDRQAPLRTMEILRIATQVSEGLAAAHQQGLIHRDIKPANILLENGVERVKLTDFGLARAVDDATITRTGEVSGTPQYMSPEQARGERVDQRSDLFSLGSVLYAMCTGRCPFRADSLAAAIRRVCEDTPRPIREINPEVPAWLIDIIQRLLAKNPADRFESAKELGDVLGRHLAKLQQPAAGEDSHERINRQYAATGPVRASVATAVAAAPSPRNATARTIRRPEWARVLGLVLVALGVLLVVGGIGSAIYGLVNESSGMAPSGLHAFIVACGLLPLIAGMFLRQPRISPEGLLIVLFLLLGPLGVVIWLLRRERWEQQAAEEAQAAVDDDRGVDRDSAAVQQMLKGPANGLAATALLNWTAYVVGAILLAAVPEFRPPQEIVPVMIAAGAFLFLGAGLIWRGSLAMKQRDSYRWAIAGAVAAMIIGPGYFIGWPAGIWASAVLRRDDVHSAFRHRGGSWAMFPALLGAVVAPIAVGAFLLSQGLQLFEVVMVLVAAALLFGVPLLILWLLLHRREGDERPVGDRVQAALQQPWKILAWMVIGVVSLVLFVVPCMLGVPAYFAARSRPQQAQEARIQAGLASAPPQLQSDAGGSEMSMGGEGAFTAPAAQGAVILQILDEGLTVYLQRVNAFEGSAESGMDSMSSMGMDAGMYGGMSMMPMGSFGGSGMSSRSGGHSQSATQQVEAGTYAVIVHDANVGWVLPEPDLAFGPAPPGSRTITIQPGAIVTLSVSRDWKQLAARQPDFRQLGLNQFRWFGTEYPFSPAQGRVVQRLLEAHAAGEPEVAEAELLEVSQETGGPPEAVNEAGAAVRGAADPFNRYAAALPALPGMPPDIEDPFGAAGAQVPGSEPTTSPAGAGILPDDNVAGKGSEPPPTVSEPAPPESLQTLFNDGAHPAWGVLIVLGFEEGTFRLGEARRDVRSGTAPVTIDVRSPDLSVTLLQQQSFIQGTYGETTRLRLLPSDYMVRIVDKRFGWFGTQFAPFVETQTERIYGITVKVGERTTITAERRPLKVHVLPDDTFTMPGESFDNGGSQFNFWWNGTAYPLTRLQAAMVNRLLKGLVEEAPNVPRQALEELSATIDLPEGANREQQISALLKPDEGPLRGLVVPGDETETYRLPQPLTEEDPPRSISEPSPPANSPMEGTPAEAPAPAESTLPLEPESPALPEAPADSPATAKPE